MQGWLELFKFPSVERTTYDRCECTARNQIYPMHEDKTVGDITAADIKALLNHFMNDGYAYTTVKKIHNLLGEYLISTANGIPPGGGIYTYAVYGTENGRNARIA